jgi:hypothetical protein
MPMKLNVGFSRKIGEPNYGSRGASIHLEVELDSGVLCDPDNMRACVHRLYALARQSVNDELQRPDDGVAKELVSVENPGEASAEPEVHREPMDIRNCNGQHTQRDAEHRSVGQFQPHASQPANGRTNGGSNDSAVRRTAEPSTNGDTNHRNGSANGHTNRIEVARATQSQIRAIFAITKRQGLDPHTVISERFRVHRMEDLTIREASAIIDELKSGAGVRS